MATEKCIVRVFKEDVEVQVITCKDHTEANSKAIAALSDSIDNGWGYTHTTVETEEGEELGIFGRCWADVKPIVRNT